MLKRLDISNYALIENVNLLLKPGFTVITGETGAGKSILIKALYLLLGDRVDMAVLKNADKKCILEAEFDISKLSLQPYFEAHELDYDTTCILRREITAGGKTRAFINDTPVQLSQLKTLGDQLISIHSQHQTLSILENSFQLDVIDYFAGIEKETASYKKLFKTYRENVNLLTSLKLKEQENRKEKDYLSFLWTELDEANLEKLNFEELKLRFLKIENGEKIRHSLEFAKAVFDHEQQAPIVGIKRLIDTIDELTKFGGNFNEISTRLHSIKIELEDLEQEITNLEEEDYSSIEEIEFVREKIEKINALLFKHNLTDEKQLIELKSTLSTKLADIVNSEDLIEKISAELQVSKKEILQKAAEISEKRKAVKSHLEKEVHRRLTNLGMPNAALEIQLNPKEKPSETGMDDIEFLAKTNLGGQFSPLKKVASGGELSRLMLAIMSILSEKKNLPTLLFDEIDTGVSGEIANKIALEFDSMGKQIQVIAITHLPQVAAKGKTHLHVSKESSNEKTITFVKELIESQRIDVLASMISGEEITEAAKKNALHLLTNN